jgi:hypothetical protein
MSRTIMGRIKTAGAASWSLARIGGRRTSKRLLTTKNVIGIV